LSLKVALQTEDLKKFEDRTSVNFDFYMLLA